MIQHVVRKTGDDEEAQDLVQETFLIACMKIHEVEQHSKPPAWLYSTLNNHISRTRRHATLSLDQFREDTLMAEDAVALELMLPRELSPTARQIVLFRIRDKLSYAEIAEETGMTEAACRKQMSRAMALCKKIWEK